MGLFHFLAILSFTFKSMRFVQRPCHAHVNINKSKQVRKPIQKPTKF